LTELQRNFQHGPVDGNHQDAPLQRPGTRRRAWSLAVALVMMAGALVWWFERQMPPDPLYQGKALSAWLQTYAPSSPFVPHSPEWKQTDEAVRQIGTKGIPLLVQMLRQRDSKLKVWLLGFAQKHGLSKRLHLAPARERNFEASRAFIALGDLASGAVPDLVQAYRENENIDCRGAIADALGWIGPGAKPAIPLLLEAATNANSKVRANALWALGEIHAEPQLCVPKLISGLGDTNDWAQLSAAHALGRFGTNAQPAVPVLTGLASITNLTVVRTGFSRILTMRTQVRFEARKALERIDPGIFAHLNDTSPVSGVFTTNGGFELLPSAP
jgi:hypothetical protein